MFLSAVFLFFAAPARASEGGMQVFFGEKAAEYHAFGGPS